MRGEVVKFHVCYTTIVNSASLTSRIFIGRLKEKPSEGCQKDDKKLSKVNQKLYQMATVGRVENDHKGGFQDDPLK